MKRIFYRKRGIISSILNFSFLVDEKYINKIILYPYLRSTDRSRIYEDIFCDLLVELFTEIYNNVVLKYLSVFKLSRSFTLIMKKVYFIFSKTIFNKKLYRNNCYNHAKYSKISLQNILLFFHIFYIQKKISLMNKKYTKKVMKVSLDNIANRTQLPGCSLKSVIYTIPTKLEL